MSYLDRQLLGSKRGNLNAYQACPYYPRWELLALPDSPPFQNETCQFLLRTRNLRRQSLLLLLLLWAEPVGMVVQPVQGSVGVAIRLVEGRLGLGNLVMIRQSRQVVGHLLLQCG